jgi:hypothetical protein
MLAPLSNIADAPIKIEAFSQKKMTEFVWCLVMLPAEPLPIVGCQNSRNNSRHT